MTDQTDTEKPSVRVGNYRHYRGGTYAALGIVAHHDSRAPMVLYVSHATGELSVRPLKPVPGDPDAWDDWVNHEGKRVRRFSYMGEKPIEVPPPIHVPEPGRET